MLQRGEGREMEGVGGGSSCDGKRASEERPGKTDPINTFEALQVISPSLLPSRGQTCHFELVLFAILSTFQRLSMVLKLPRQLLEGEDINYF